MALLIEEPSVGAERPCDLPVSWDLEQVGVLEGNSLWRGGASSRSLTTQGLSILYSADCWRVKITRLFVPSLCMDDPRKPTHSAVSNDRVERAKVSGLRLELRSEFFNIGGYPPRNTRCRKETGWVNE